MFRVQCLSAGGRPHSQWKKLRWAESRWAMCQLGGCPSNGNLEGWVKVSKPLSCGQGDMFT